VANEDSVRAIGERGNFLPKTTFRALRNVSLRLWSIGRSTAAALVILHVEHGALGGIRTPNLLIRSSFGPPRHAP
jgi:hypothetical protein